MSLLTEMPRPTGRAAVQPEWRRETMGELSRQRRRPRLNQRLAAALGAVALMFTAGGATAQQMGGDVVVAQNSNPPSLDAMVTSSQASRNINMNIYEALFVFDENIQPIPLLAEDLEISDDGLTYRIPLRQGVKFHNGKEMTAEDVKASLERYRLHGASAGIMEPVDSIEITGDYEVTLHLKQRTPPFLAAFSSPRAPVVIIPAEEATKGPNEIEIIGTGPYQFVEYVPDSHVKLARFDDYVADTRYEGSNGFGGHKVAYFDTVTVRVMPEAGARAAALQAGEIHVVEQIPAPAGRRLESDPNIAVYENKGWAFLNLILNWKQPPGDNPKFREAIEVGLNMEEVMAIATEGLYDLENALQHPGTAFYFPDIGKDLYNQGDAERAKALLAEAGYDGAEFQILTDTNYGEHNRAAVVIAEQLKGLGINAVVNQVDWPTALQIRLQDEGWNGWTLMMGIEPYLGPYGYAATFTGDTGHQRVRDEVLEEAYQRLISEPEEAARQQAFADFQTRFYEMLPTIKLGNVSMMQATRANVKGFVPFRFPRMYNVWFEEG
jgi:peptide/nickel transport system substrate-binding protein